MTTTPITRDVTLIIARRALNLWKATYLLDVAHGREQLIDNIYEHFQFDKIMSRGRFNMLLTVGYEAAKQGKDSSEIADMLEVTLALAGTK